MNTPAGTPTGEGPAAPRANAYRLVDWATQIYLVVVALLILVGHGRGVRWWGALLAAHAAAILLVHGLVRCHHAGRGGPGVAFLRNFYPILLYTGFYRETGELNQLFVTGYLDAWFIRADQWLFGRQPCLEFMDRFPARWVAECLYAAYFSYYVMIAGIGVALLCRNRRQFLHYVTVVSLVFYACYLTYIVLPVMGPRIFQPGTGEDLAAVARFHPPLPAEFVPLRPLDYPAPVRESVFHALVLFLYRHFEAPGAAFPSSHVAVALTTLWFTFRYLPRLRSLHTVAVLGLCAGTIYCRYHYVVDVLAGILTAVVLVRLAEWLYRHVEGPPPPGALRA